MRGYVPVKVDDFHTVVDYYDNWYEDHVDRIKSVKKAAYDHYVKRILGTRTFWHWLYLVPWSEKASRDLAIDDLNSGWRDGCHYHAAELELSTKHYDIIMQLSSIICYLRSNIDDARACVARADKERILLDVDSSREMTRFLNNMRKLDLHDFPIFE